MAIAAIPARRAITNTIQVARDNRRSIECPVAKLIPIAIIKPTGATTASGISKYTHTFGATIPEITMSKAAKVGRLKITTVQSGHVG